FRGLKDLYQAGVPQTQPSKYDIQSNLWYNNASSQHYAPLYREALTGSLSFVTGAHALKGGAQWSMGYSAGTVTSSNGDLTQEYRNGVPFAVLVRDTPNFHKS